MAKYWHVVWEIDRKTGAARCVSCEFNSRETARSFIENYAHKRPDHDYEVRVREEASG